MAGTQERLAGRLRVEGEKTLEFFHELTPDQMEQTIYTDGSRWTVRQVLAHFVSSEYSMTRLIENVLAGGPGSPEDFNLNEYNERRVARLHDAGVEELLQQYAGLRAATANLVEGLKDADLERSGRHPFLGVTTLEEIIKMFYRHNQIHQREIRRFFAP